MQIWYENNSVQGIDKNTIKNAVKGKEITKDVKVNLVDSIAIYPIVINERIIIGKLNNYTDSLGAKLDYETIYTEYKFLDYKYVPTIK
jgi:hypothetical protein